MPFKDIARWNSRVSLMYAIGVWTLIGTYGYYTYTGKYKRPEPLPDSEKEEELPNPNEVVFETAHSKTVMVYKENFVPYSTRIMNFISSFSADSKK